MKNLLIMQENEFSGTLSMYPSMYPAAIVYGKPGYFGPFLENVQFSKGYTI